MTLLVSKIFIFSRVSDIFQKWLFSIYASNFSLFLGADSKCDDMRSCCKDLGVHDRVTWLIIFSIFSILILDLSIY